MRMLILYGSQTGTAQDVAEQIWRESRQYGFSGPVLALDDYPTQQLIGEDLTIFVVSTTGNGDEPDNMKQTWKFLLRRNLPEDSLWNLRFGVLGLGDSSYSRFNYTAKKLQKRLQGLGATCIFPPGFCDDQHDHGYAAVALPWITKIWETLAGNRQTFVKSNEPIYKWKVNVLEAEGAAAPAENLMHWPIKDAPIQLKLKLNMRTTAEDHFQDVRFLSFDVPDGIKWQPGDALQVVPCNTDKQVSAFFSLVQEHQLGFDEDTVVELSSNDAEMRLPRVFSRTVCMGHLVKYVWELGAQPRQRFFELLALNCTDELEREKLIEFTTSEGLDELINYINRPKRTLLEVLQDFRNATSKITFQTLFEMMPIIQPRSFSIASSANSKSLDLLVAVVNYRTKLSTPRLGLCSNWLAKLESDASIAGNLKRGTLVLPNDKSTPIIMVGPGTGIAPFRSFVQYRLESKRRGETVGPSVIFFGCRRKSKDFHFAEDFMKWQMDESDVHVFFAFSRDHEHKVYVQHKIREQSEIIKQLIREKNAHIYVAGSSKNMPAEVKEAFIIALDDDAAYIDHMIRMRQYQEETWS